MLIGITFCHFYQSLIVFAPTLSKRIASYLTYMIEDHLMQFKELYSNCPIIPKQYYLNHIPQWIVT